MHHNLIYFSVECNIKCYMDAIGDCYTKDEFIMYEPEVFKVTSRAFCRNQNGNICIIEKQFISRQVLVACQENNNISWTFPQEIHRLENQKLLFKSMSVRNVLNVRTNFYVIFDFRTYFKDRQSKTETDKKVSMREWCGNQR